MTAHSMKAIVFDRIGPPGEVLHLDQVPVPRASPDEVLVRMVASAVNPGDFLFVQGLYPEPKTPKLPRQIAGNHGVGVVVTPDDAGAFRPGDLVAFSHFNAWSEFAAIPAVWLIPLPADYPVEKAAQLFNFITARDLVDQAAVSRGDWMAVTAARSTVGLTVARMAAARGVKVLSIVRRLNPVMDAALPTTPGFILALGATDRRLRDQVLDLTGGGIAALVDSAGGPPTGDLLRASAFGARAIFYGGQDEASFTLHNFDVLLKDLRIAGYAYRYFFTPPPATDREFLAEVVRETADGSFTAPIGRRVSLADATPAIQDVALGRADGKLLIEMGA